jgi:PAS domain S-box-containing protein
MPATGRTPKGQKPGGEKKASIPKREKPHRADFPPTTSGKGLREKESLLYLLAENTVDVFWVLNADSTCNYVSPSIASFTGHTVEEFMTLRLEDYLVPESLEKSKAILLEELTRKCKEGDAVASSTIDLEFLCKDGSRKWGEVRFRALRDDAGRFCKIVGVVRDETDRLVAEREREAMLELHRLIAGQTDLRHLMQDMSAYLKRWSGCDAIGIRLREGDDFPYYETSGFPLSFVRAENSLCAVDAKGEMLRDSTGNPVIECMCGNVLCGRFNLDLPFFTARGSFWSSCTTELLTSTSDKDRQARTRNRCNGEGYESVALVALRFQGEIFGLLQFNDLKKDRFTKGKIAMLERIADILAIALAQRKTKESLEESERRFRKLAETAPTGIYVTDAKGRCTYVNEHWSRMAGLTVGEAMGDGWINGIHPEDREEVFSNWNRMVESEGNWGLEYRFRDREGKITWVCGTAAPIRSDAGEVTGFVGANLDISDWKMAVAALQESERRYRIVAANTYDWEFWQRPDGSFEYVSPSCKRITGIEASELLENPGRLLSIIHPGDRESYENHLVEAMRGESCEQTFFRIVAPDGSHRWIGHACQPVFGEAGRFLGIRGSNRDVTQQKQAEQALRQSEERFRLITSSTPDHLVVQDRDLRYSLVINPQLGLTEQDMIGKTDHDILSKEDADKLAAIKRQVLETGCPVTLELPLLSGKGEEEFFNGSYVPTHDTDGRVDGLIGYFRNVTERKQAEATLRESEHRYRSLFESSADGILMKIADGRVADANPAACAMFGMTREEICRARREDLVENDARLAYAVRERQNTGRFRGELTYIRKNGTTFTGEVTSVALPDDAGPARSFVLIRDITMRKLAIEALSESEDLFRTLSEKSMAGIYVVQDGVFKLVNPNAAAYCERFPEEMIGIPSDHIIHPGDREPARQNAAAMLKGEISSPYEFRVVTPRGETRWVLETVTSIVYEGKRAILGNSTDITERKRTEQALAASERQFRLLAENATDMITRHRPDGTVLYISPACIPALGYDPGELTSRSVYDFVHPDDGEEFANVHKAVLEDAASRTIVCRLRRKDGSWGWFEITAKSLRADKKGPVEEIIAVTRDVSERKKAEKAIAASEEKFSRAFLANPDLMAISTIGDGCYVDANEAFLDVLGFAREEIIGQTSTGLNLWVDPADRQKLADELRDTGHVKNREFTVRTKTGNPRTLLFSAETIELAGVTHMLSMARDITERKQAEEALKNQAEFLQTLIDTIPIPVYFKDSTGIYLGCNKACEFLWGPREQVIGRTVYGVSPGEVADVYDRADLELFSNPGIQTYETVATDRKGETRNVIFSKSTYLDNNGDVAGLVGAIFDITEQKAAEEELRESRAKLNLALQSAGMGAWHWDIAEDRRHFDEQACQLLGIDPAAFTGTADEFFVVVHRDDWEKLREELNRAIEQDMLYEPEYRVVWPDGSIHHMAARGRMVRDAEGRPVRLTGIIWDITERKVGEEALRESEARFRLLIESAPNGLFVQTKGCIRYLNQAALRILGADSPDRLIGKPFLERIHPDFLERVKNRSRTVTEEGKAVPIQEQVYLRLDGIPVDVSVSVVPIHYEGENGALVFLRDITDQKQASLALWQSEAQYRLLFDNMMSGFALHEIICSADGRPVDYRFISVNAAFEKLTGLRGEDIIGRTVRDVIPGMEDGWIERYGKVALQGEEVHFEDYSVPLGKYFEIRAFSPERGKFAVLFSDVSQRRQVEDALRKSEEQYRHLFENALEGMFRSTPEGRYIKVNPALARMFGHDSPEEMIEQVTDIGRELYVDPDERARCIRILREEGALRRFEVQMRRRDGARLWTVINSRVVRDDAGKVLYIEGMISDITDLKRAEEALEESERRLRQAQKMEAIGTLAGGIAHDFNNILAAIIGYTEMSLCSSVTKKQILENLEHVLKAGLRAKDLIKQILAFSRQGDQEFKPILIHLLLKEAAKMLRASLPSTIRIRQNIRAGVGAILGDPTQIHQVVMNLATNAAHAMHETGGTLGIELAGITLDERDATAIHDELPAGAYLKLTVSDTGRGIEPSILHRIFDPFFTTKEPGEGTGMGLAVVHGIVKSHGGVITVDSDPGKGTEFRVYFPAMEPEATMAASEASMRDFAKGKGRVLFVDDEEALTLLSGQLLSRLGYEVVTRTSSLEALEAFRANPDRFDLVITDQTMPRMTGIELAQEMLRIRPEVPIILCTGFSEAVTPEKAKSMGIREYLMKPLVMRQMADTISGLLDTQGKLRL